MEPRPNPYAVPLEALRPVVGTELVEQPEPCRPADRVDHRVDRLDGGADVDGDGD